MEEEEEETELNLKNFIESRYQEMKTMLELSSKVSSNNAPHQQMPRHMRRRAASHNVKRLPLALREKFLQEHLKGGLPVKNKRPSRKHRRRPRNFFSEYSKRMRNFRWMETHIWHARRFHMGNLWRCKIPLYRNDRGVKAAYRDAKNECLIADISYMHCIEIVGKKDDIISKLNFYTHPHIGTSFSDEDILTGKKEGKTMLYKNSGYPHKPLTLAKFIWKSEIIQTTMRSLFVWIHPSSFSEVLNILVEDFSLKLIEDETNKIYSKDGFKLIDRTGDFNRFHLIGAKAQSLLFNSVKVNFPDHDTMKTLYNFSNDEISLIKTQLSFWQKNSLFTHQIIPANSIISVYASDPRLNMRIKNNCDDTFESKSPSVENISIKIPHTFSSIWDINQMKALKEKSLSTQQVNELKSGTSFYNYNPSIPIILIHNPCIQSLNGGWDIVLPIGWGLSFWLAFIYRGARSIGLKELEHMNFETQQLSFPALFSDTNAGKEYHLNEFSNLYSKYQRMPPSKRCNFIKYNVPSPFHFPFQELCNWWVKSYSDEHKQTFENASYFVLRNPKILKELKYKLVGTRKRKQDTQEVSKDKLKCIVRVRNSSKVYASFVSGTQSKVLCLKDFTPQSEIFDNILKQYLFGLVPIHLVVSGKGSPSKFSIIYLPSDDDLKNIKEQNSVEDESLIKCLKIKKFRKKKKSKTENKQSELSIPPQIDENQLQNSSKCGRLVIGYVTQGGFSYSLSRGAAIGFVSLPGVLKLFEVYQKFINSNLDFKTVKCIVLIRDTNSFGPKYLGKYCSRSRLNIARNSDKGENVNKTSLLDIPSYVFSTQTDCYQPSYNISPGRYCPVLISSKHLHVDKLNVMEDDEFEKELQEKNLKHINKEIGYVIQTMQWSLIPSWHKGPLKEFGLKMNNTRVESLEKPMFKKLMKKNRCVVLADGFYEWKTENGRKQPYIIYFDDNTIFFNSDSKESDKKKMEDEEKTTCKLLTMAGLFDACFCREKNQEVYTFSIITVRAEGPVSGVHERMPAILKNDEIEKWLDFENYPPEKVIPLLKARQDMSMHAVSSVVNNANNDSIECVKAIDPKKFKESSKKENCGSSSFLKAWMAGSKKRTADDICNETKVEKDLKKQKN